MGETREQATGPAGWVEPLRQALPDRVTVDADLLEAHRRDHAGLVPAGVPAALVRPKSTAEVRTVMRLAHEHHVPVVARGAGSGLAGAANASDGCLVLSLTEMDRILAIDDRSMLARVQPGVVNGRLREAAQERGLWYPPDPASYEMSTIGGNIATNAGGLCCVKYGVTRESVLGLEVVLADGALLHCGARTLKSVAGYDLVSLFVGSEGTLGIVTEATLRLRARPPAASTLAAFFPDLSSAGRAIQTIVHAHTPALLELMDRATLRAVEAWKQLDLETDAAAMLLAQSDAGGTEGAAEIATMAALCEQAGASFVAHTSDDAEGRMLMAARRLSYPALERRGATLLDDVAVPIGAIPDMLAQIERIANLLDVEVGTFGHAGDGNLHPTIVYDRHDADSTARAREAFDEIVGAALTLGGSVTGEHGIGLLKRDYLASELGDVGMRVHRAIKQALDPHGLLNPGKVLATIG